MGIIKKVGEAIANVGERFDRATSTIGTGMGYRSRSHALRSRIDSLSIPKVLSSRRQVRRVAAAPVTRRREGYDAAGRKEMPQSAPRLTPELQSPSQASLASVGGGLEDLTLSQNSGLAEGISFRSN